MSYSRPGVYVNEAPLKATATAPVAPLLRLLAKPLVVRSENQYSFLLGTPLSAYSVTSFPRTNLGTLFTNTSLMVVLSATLIVYSPLALLLTPTLPSLLLMIVGTRTCSRPPLNWRA